MLLVPSSVWEGEGHGGVDFTPAPVFSSSPSTSSSGSLSSSASAFPASFCALLALLLGRRVVIRRLPLFARFFGGAPAALSVCLGSAERVSKASATSVSAAVARGGVEEVEELEEVEVEVVGAVA